MRPGEADIDLYVAPPTIPNNYALTNLDTNVLVAADKSLSRGGTEYVVYSNAVNGRLLFRREMRGPDGGAVCHHGRVQPVPVRHRGPQRRPVLDRHPDVPAHPGRKSCNAGLRADHSHLQRSRFRCAG